MNPWTNPPQAPLSSWWGLKPIFQMLKLTEAQNPPAVTIKTSTTPISCALLGERLVKWDFKCGCECKLNGAFLYVTISDWIHLFATSAAEYHQKMWNPICSERTVCLEGDVLQSHFLRSRLCFDSLDDTSPALASSESSLISWTHLQINKYIAVDAAEKILFICS